MRTIFFIVARKKVTYLTILVVVACSVCCCVLFGNVREEKNENKSEIDHQNKLIL